MESMPFVSICETERNLIDAWWEVVTDAEVMMSNPSVHTEDEICAMYDSLSDVERSMRDYGYSGIEPREWIAAIDSYFYDGE